MVFVLVDWLDLLFVGIIMECNVIFEYFGKIIFSIIIIIIIVVIIIIIIIIIIIMLKIIIEKIIILSLMIIMVLLIFLFIIVCFRNFIFVVCDIRFFGCNFVYLRI